MKNNWIIRHLNAFPAGEVYYVSPKEYFKRGFNYYKEARLLDFNWSEDYQVLTAKVNGNNIYSVNFFVNGNGLEYECNCPAWSPNYHCKHVICSLLTIKNILDPELFKTGIVNEGYRRSLMASLYHHTATSDSRFSDDIHVSSYSIVLKKGPYINNVGLIVIKDGLPASGNILLRVPRELTSLAYESFRYNIYPSKDFEKYLLKHGNLYPIFLEINGEKIPLHWDLSHVFTTKTEINVTKLNVTIKRLCFFQGGICESSCQIGGNIVVDLETGKLGKMKSRKGWHIWQLYKDRLKKDKYELLYNSSNVKSAYFDKFNDDADRVIQIPIKMFQDIQLIIPQNEVTILQDLILKVDQKETTPASIEHGYSITLNRHDHVEDKVILRVCCDIPGFKDSTTVSIFNFLPFVISSRYVSSFLRAQKRWSVLVRTFLILLSSETKEEADNIIRDSLTNGDFYRRDIMREAKKLLEDAFLRIKAISLKIQYSDGKWYMSRNEINKEALLYTIPFEIFGIDIFKHMWSHDEMTVKASHLYRNLETLYMKLKEHGIKLFFHGKPVVTARWNFSIDATRHKEIDWFEIKPEIRCDGQPIDDEIWQKSLGQNGVVEKDGFIQILDSNTREILKGISSVYPADSISSGRPKEIVRIPRLKILDWINLRNKGVKIRLSKADEELIERLNHFEKIEDRYLPERLNAKLRPYQREGYYWLSFLYEHRFGACLADDMGLGKTLQAITLLAGIKEGLVKPPDGYIKGVHLVVLPPSLLFNWESEINKFYPDLKICLYTGKERHTDFKDCDIVLTTYGLVRRDIEQLKKISFNVIIFDEAQAIKNIYADTTCAVRQLKGYFKLTMTGTPLENHLGEYYSILDLSIPGLLGEYDDFKSHIKMEASPLIDLILRRTKPFVLRRTKEKILKELPPKTESDIYLELTEKQKALYKKTVEMVRSTIDNAYENKTVSQAHIIALTAILKLRQICVSPRLIDPAMNEPSPKIEFLIGKLMELLSEGHNALVFSQFTSFLDIVEEDLKKNEIPFYRLDGSTAVRNRKRLVEGFQNGKEASVFLLSLKAGGQGLNLTRASYVFHLDPWWNPAVENQASDRAHRIGQKNKVTIMRILMHHTVEEKMMELKKKKLALYNAVMGVSIRGKKGLSISKSDFDYLLK